MAADPAAIHACIEDLSAGLTANINFAAKLLSITGLDTQRAQATLTATVTEVCNDLRNAATNPGEACVVDVDAFSSARAGPADGVDADCKTSSVDPARAVLALDPAHGVPNRQDAPSVFEVHEMWADGDEGGNEEPNANTICTGGVLNPNWSWRLAWDAIVLLLVTADVMVLPFQIAYRDTADAEHAEPDDFDVLWLWLTTSFFVSDMVISFFTGYQECKDGDISPGRLVTNKLRIASNYLRGWFSIDLVSTIPWGVFADLIAGDSSSSSAAQMAKLTKVVKFIRFLRLMRMLRLAKLAVVWERLHSKLGSVALFQTLVFIRVLTVLAGICHWNACVWWIIGKPQSLFIDILPAEAQRAWRSMPHWTTIPEWDHMDEVEVTWLDRSQTEQYIFCFYWTLGVMRTMPSEVKPINIVERLYIMIFMFFAFSAFAICITQITRTFFKLFERRSSFNDDMAAVRMRLRDIDASEALQSSVKVFLKHLFEKRRIHARENELLKHLPKQIQHDLKYAQCAEHFLKSNLTKDLPSRALQILTSCAEVRDLITGERVSVAHKPAKAAWILMSGCLCIEDELPRLSVGSTGREGKVELVDMECLVSPEVKSSKDTIMAAMCCEIIRVDKKKFFMMGEENPYLQKRIQDSAQRVSAQLSELRKMRSSDPTGNTVTGNDCDIVCSASSAMI